MFDYNKGEASELGFEPLGAQTSKPEINVVNLSDYSQVMVPKNSLAVTNNANQTSINTTEETEGLT